MHHPENHRISPSYPLLAATRCVRMFLSTFRTELDDLGGFISFLDGEELAERLLSTHPPPWARALPPRLEMASQVQSWPGLQLSVLQQDVKHPTKQNCIQRLGFDDASVHVKRRGPGACLHIGTGSPLGYQVGTMFWCQMSVHEAAK